MKLLFRGTTGSTLYGTDNADSDVDYGEVYLEKPEAMLGVDPIGKLSHLVSDDNDRQRHWLHRWCYLCMKGNPNVLEYLFIPESLIEEVHPLFKELFLDDPTIFLFRKGLFKAHHGFADQQIVKMTKGNDAGWKRKQYVAKYGYDIKFAAHALRLMFQLKEIASTGTVIYPYEEGMRNQILEVRNGHLTLDEFKAAYAVLKAEVIALEDKSYPHIQDEWDSTEVNARLLQFYKEVWDF